ncbi:MAG: sugar phosphate isomerase/epimerase family protein [Gemmataceae bacterium]
MANTFPKLHNAAWPGVVGKEPGSDQPPIDLDTMLDLTAAAEVDGVKFDGFDLFLFAPHINIDATEDELKQLAEKASSRGLVIGSVVAPVWPPTDGGSAMDEGEGRTKFLTQVRKGCRIAKFLRENGIRPYGVVRIDSACGPADWSADPEANQTKIAETFRQACDIAADHGEQLAAEGEICWGGMHSWKKMLDLLEKVNRPNVLGFQADMAHTLMYLLGANAPEDALLPQGFDWSDSEKFDAAYKQMTDALRPWTIDFHIAQNDGTVHGTGSHDKTGKHCPANDENGKLEITKHAGYWLRDENGQPHKKYQHICWDGCMFPNEMMMKPETWNNILAVMIDVREAHGWN